MDRRMRAKAERFGLLRRGAVPWVAVAALVVAGLLAVSTFVSLQNVRRSREAAEALASQLRERDEQLAEQTRSALLNEKRLEHAQHTASAEVTSLNAEHEQRVLQLAQTHQQQQSKANDELEAARQEAAQQRQRAEDLLVKNEADAKSLKSRTERLEGQLASVRDGLMEQADTLAMRVSQMQTELATMSGLVSSSVDRFEEAIAARSEDTEEERRKLTILFGQLRDHVSNVTGLPETLQRRIEKMNQLYETYVAEREQVGERYQNLGRTVTETLEALIGELADQLDRVRLELEVATQQLEQLEAEREQLGTENDDDPADPRREARAKRRNELAAQIEDAQAKHARLETQRDALTDAWPRCANARRRLIAVLKADAP